MYICVYMEQLAKLLKLLIDLKELQARYTSEGVVSQNSVNINRSITNIQKEIISQHYLPEVFLQINRLRSGIGSVYKKLYQYHYTDYEVTYIQTNGNKKIPGIELIASIPRLYYLEAFARRDGAKFSIYDREYMTLVTCNEWDTNFQTIFKEQIKNVFLVCSSSQLVTDIFGGLIVEQNYFVVAKKPYGYLYYEDFLKQIVDTNPN